jgi:hypothetical protein
MNYTIGTFTKNSSISEDKLWEIKKTPAIKGYAISMMYKNKTVVEPIVGIILPTMYDFNEYMGKVSTVCNIRVYSQTTDTIPEKTKSVINNSIERLKKDYEIIKQTMINFGEANFDQQPLDHMRITKSTDGLEGTDNISALLSVLFKREFKGKNDQLLTQVSISGTKISNDKYTRDSLYRTLRGNSFLAQATTYYSAFYNMKTLSLSYRFNLAAINLIPIKREENAPMVEVEPQEFEDTGL